MLAGLGRRRKTLPQAYSPTAAKTGRAGRFVAQESVRHLDQDTGTIAQQRIVAGRAAVGQVFEDLQALGDDAVALDVPDMGDKADAAGVVLVGRVVESLSLGGSVIHLAILKSSRQKAGHLSPACLVLLGELLNIPYWGRTTQDADPWPGPNWPRCLYRATVLDRRAYLGLGRIGERHRFAQPRSTPSAAGQQALSCRGPSVQVTVCPQPRATTGKPARSSSLTTRSRSAAVSQPSGETIPRP